MPGFSQETLVTLNDEALVAARRYMCLRYKSVRVRTPYHSNIQFLQLRSLLSATSADTSLEKKLTRAIKGERTDFGWLLGKGTPHQLEERLGKLIVRSGLGDQLPSAYGLSELMKFYGLGVDCSGFVYNVLAHSFERANLSKQLVESLAWVDDRHDVFHAGSSAFANGASSQICPSRLQPLDIVVIRGELEISHVALILKDQCGFVIAQSSLVTCPVGVTIRRLDFTNGMPDFPRRNAIGTPWNNLIELGRLEFRRLNCIRGTCE